MALSGNFSGKTSNQFVKPTIYWSAVQNLLENYSDITVELRYSRTNTGYTTQGGFSGAIYIDKGLSTEQKATGKKSVCTVTYKSNTLAMTAAFRVYHESNGDKSITISATGAISGTSVESTTISQLIALDTIPRASSIGAADANIGATSMVVVTKKNPTYKHSVAYRFGTLSGYIKADGTATDSEVIFSETSIAFALPDDFYDQIPNFKSGKCTLICKTYYGGAQIGDDQTVTFTAVAAEGICAPNVSGTVVDVNEVTKALTGDENILVRYHSTARCAITAAAKCSASLVSQTVNSAALESALEIPAVQTGSFTFGVTDSRGYTATEKVTKNLIPYVKLTANAAVKRTDPTSGMAILTVKGNYFAGNFGNAENTLTLSYRVGSGETVALTPTFSGNTYSATAELEGLAYDQSFPMTISAEDRLEQVNANVTVAKGIPTFEWGEGDFHFHVPVAFDKPSETMSNLIERTVATDANVCLESGNYYTTPDTTNTPVAGNGNLRVVKTTVNWIWQSWQSVYSSVVYTRNSRDNGVTFDNWDTGFVKKTGDTMTGYLINTLDSKGRATMAGTEIGAFLEAYTDDFSYRRQLVLRNQEKMPNIAEAVYLAEATDGQNWKSYRLYGEHNKPPVMTRLWTNASPTSTFTSFTPISLDLTDYKYVLVWYRLYASDSTAQHISSLVPVGVGSGTSNDDTVNATVCFAATDDKWVRRYCFASTSAVTFGSGGQRTSVSANYTVDNKYMIPEIIYGIR